MHGGTKQVVSMFASRRTTYIRGATFSSVCCLRFESRPSGCILESIAIFSSVDLRPRRISRTQALRRAK